MDRQLRAALLARLHGELVFSQEWADIAWGMNRCLARLGALPQKVVWDREGAIDAGDGRPTEAFAGWCGQLALGWVILDPGDCQAKGALERSHRLLHGDFEAGRPFANPLDYRRRHRTTRALVSERLEASAGVRRDIGRAKPARAPCG